jgi:glycosyltransferase involved in cell wall biosynthesis
LRIALLHPTYWPEVRRGSERLAHDLGATLARRGHEVTLLTSHRGPPLTSVEDGVRVSRARRPPRRGGLHLYEDHVENSPRIIARLLRGEFDLAHALYPADAWAAGRARRLGGPPSVFSVHGIVDRPYLVGRRRRVELFRDAAAGAAVTTALSDAAAEPLRRYALADPVVLPGGVIASEYAGEVRRPPTPTLLCPASLTDPRKRAPLLFEALARLRRTAEVRLRLAGGHDPFSSYTPPPLPAGAERVNADPPGALAELYRTASVTVLPSLNEAFGLVLLESLSAGTPVVAARSGGCPEVVTDDAVGRLFEPDDAADLERAIVEAVELAELPGTAAACRAHAAEWDWQRLIERYEEVYACAIEGQR